MRLLITHENMPYNFNVVMKVLLLFICNSQVHTNIGRGRFFIRAALVKQALQSLVDIFVKDEIFVFVSRSF